MAQRIADSQSFLEICTQNDIKVVLLDLRGTLFKAPRQGNIARAAAAIGIDEKEIVDIDRKVPGEVIDVYRDEVGVFDWTLWRAAGPQ